MFVWLNDIYILVFCKFSYADNFDGSFTLGAKGVNSDAVIRQLGNVIYFCDHFIKVHRIKQAFKYAIVDTIAKILKRFGQFCSPPVIGNIV